MKSYISGLQHVAVFVSNIEVLWYGVNFDVQAQSAPPACVIVCIILLLCSVIVLCIFNNSFMFNIPKICLYLV